MASEEPVYYKVHSMVRRVQTRTQRQKAAGRHRFVQRLAGGDITVRRARPATVSEAQVREHLEELTEAVAEGRIEVRTMTGAVVDLSTMGGGKPVAAPPKDTASPAPNPPLDSAANDKTFEHGVGEVREEEKPLPEPEMSGALAGDEEQAVDAGGKDPAKVRGKKKKSKKSGEE